MMYPALPTRLPEGISILPELPAPLLPPPAPLLRDLWRKDYHSRLVLGDFHVHKLTEQCSFVFQLPELPQLPSSTASFRFGYGQDRSIVSKPFKLESTPECKRQECHEWGLLYLRRLIYLAAHIGCLWLRQSRSLERRVCIVSARIRLKIN